MLHFFSVTLVRSLSAALPQLRRRMAGRLAWIAGVVAFWATPAWAVEVVPNAIVAADGTGQYTSLQEAIDAAPLMSAAPAWVILVKPGYYHAPIYVPREKRFLTIVGENPLRTTLGFDLTAAESGADGRPIGMYRTATLYVDADDFVLENLSVANSTGPNGPAVALRIDGDRAVFRNCRFLGWQGTVLANRGRQYFERCLITGHEDFIAGAATSYFFKCEIHSWRDGHLTAASTPADSANGFVFVDCHVTGETPAVRAFLGRPWGEYASVAFVRTTLDAIVEPAGWDSSGRPAWEQTTRFAEGGSGGAGASDHRISWAQKLEEGGATALSVNGVLGGTDRWSPSATPEAVLAPTSAIGATDLYAIPGFTRESVVRQAGALFPRAGVKLPDEPRPSTVSAVENLVYARAGGHDLQLDIYRPTEAGPLPAVLLVHGGGWVAGDRLMERPLAWRLAAQRYVVATVSYRLGRDGRFPGSVYDLKAAVRWLRANASSYGIDPNRIAIVGGSAGGTMAALLGASNGVPELEGDEGVRGVASTVQAVVGLDGAATLVDHRLISNSEKGNGRFYTFMHGTYRNSPEVWRAISPLTYLSSRSAPTFFLNSSSQMPISPGREEMVAQLRSLGIIAEIETLPDSPHPFWLVQPWFDTTVERIDGFLRRVLGPGTTTGGLPMRP